MKKFIFSLFIVLTINSVVLSQDLEDIFNAKELTLFGIDYTQCYFVTSLTFYDTIELKNLIIVWNKLFNAEKEKYLVRPFKYKHISFANDAVLEVNKKINVESRISDNADQMEHLDYTSVQEIISKYQISKDLTGIGFVLLAECYNKPEERGFYYVAFFDIATKKVFLSEKMSGKAIGFGERNHWASSYHNVLQELGKKYK